MNHTPNAMLIQNLCEEVSEDVQSLDIIFRGNDKYNFSCRLSDKDIIILCEILQNIAGLMRNLDFS